MKTALNNQMVILNPGEKMPYLKGHKLANQIGGKRMSNFSMDKCLVGSDDYNQMRSVFAAALGSSLIYPETDSVFKKGKYIVDSQTGWRFAWKLVEQLHEQERAADRPGIIGVKNVGIYSSMENLEVNGNRATISNPEIIAAIYNFIQKSGKAGKANELGIPVQVAEELFNKLSDAEKRWLYRIAGVGVRPLVRGLNGLGSYGRWDVVAAVGPGVGFGVPIEISLEKLVAKTGGAVLELLENVKTTASGLIIASEEASRQIIDMVLKKAA